MEYRFKKNYPYLTIQNAISNYKSIVHKRIAMLHG